MAVVSLALLAILLGVVAWERAAGHVPADLAATDLAVGVVLAGSAAAMGLRGGRRQVGWLLGMTALAWSAGALLPALALVHRGPLAHAVLAYPGGRLRRRPAQVAVVSGYALAAGSALGVPSFWWSVVGVVILFAAVEQVLDRRPDRRQRPAAAAAVAAWIGVVLVAGPLVRVVLPGIDRAVLLAYEATVAGAAVVLAAEGLRRRPEDVLTRFVVDLGNAATPATIRDRLADAVGDPRLVIGLCADVECRTFVDELGNSVYAPDASDGLVTTPLVRGGAARGIVIHDPVVLQDADAVGLLAAATGVAIANAELQRALQRRLLETAESRTRLVQAGDAQRRAIERSVRARPVGRLLEAEAILAASGISAAAPEVAELVEDLREARLELLRFAQGVHPEVLERDGLGVAIADLARRARCSVAVEDTFDDLDPAAESTLYFVAAEAVANAVKHAQANGVRVRLERDERMVTLRVVDDGVGGAIVHPGGGLAGLADRLEALGGRLSVTSPAGGGTVIEAAIEARSTLREPLAAATGAL